MSRTIENRLQRLEAMKPDASADTAVQFFEDGQLLRTERNGEPYDGPLEDVAVLARVNFVTPPARPDDES